MSPSVGKDIFTVEELPSFPRKEAGPRADQFADDIGKAGADWTCIRQYNARATSDQRAVSLRKKYPAGYEFKSAPLEDGRVGLFVRMV